MLVRKEQNRIAPSQPTDIEARPDAVVQTSLGSFGLDAGLPEQIDDFACQLWAAFIWVCGLVKVAWKAIETTHAQLLYFTICCRFNLLIDEICALGVIDLDALRRSHPVRREDHHGFRFHLLRDFLSNFLQDWIYWMPGWWMP